MFDLQMFAQDFALLNCHVRCLDFYELLTNVGLKLDFNSLKYKSVFLLLSYNNRKTVTEKL